MARPSKLTPDVEKTLLNALRLGLPHNRACALAGVSVAAFNEWMARGQGTDSRAQTKRFAAFAKAVAKAKAECQGRHLQNIEHHAQGVTKFLRDEQGQLVLNPATGQPIVTQEIPSSWNASAWLLERRFPEEFGNRIEHRGLGEERAPIQVMDDDRLIARMDVLMRRLLDRKSSTLALPAPQPIDAEFTRE